MNRVVWFLSVTLSLFGILAYVAMPREEDPRIERRFAVFTVVLNGAAPDKLERLVVRPLERNLLEVNEIKEVEVEVRLNVALFNIELRDNVRKIDAAWKEVERAIERARANLPLGLPPIALDYSSVETDAIVLALTGSDDLLTLSELARGLRDRLLRIGDVAEVRLYGDPGQEILIQVDSAKMFDLGLSIPTVLSSVRLNNSAASTGYVIQDGDRLVLRQDNDGDSIEHFMNFKVPTSSLRNVRLSEFAEIKRAISDPPDNLFRWNGKPSVGLGIVSREGLNVVSAGRKIMSEVKALGRDLPPGIEIKTVAYQPDRTHFRLRELLRSLILGIGLIGIFLLPIFGWRLAAVVTMAVPLITSISLFVYFLTGGFLHQISIAAFVISIGQFIDNIIVIVESMQRRVNGGEDGAQAAEAVTRQMRWPMLFATLTGICGFLPMLAAEGPTADFTFAIPLVAMISLAVSYCVAVVGIPRMTAAVITSRPESFGMTWLKSLENFVFARLAGRSALGLGLVGAIAALSVISLARVQKEFFPESDRNEFLVSLELHESADILTTDKLAAEAESWLRERKEVRSVASFVGGDTPRFYYNLPRPRRSPQVGQLLVTTAHADDIKSLGVELENEFKRRYPDAFITSHFLQQGPPINAKIEVRAFSDVASDRDEFVRFAAAWLRDERRVRALRWDSANSLAEVNMTTKEDQLADLALSREDLNGILAYYSSGVEVSQLRSLTEPIPVRVRDRRALRGGFMRLSGELAIRGRSKDFKVGDLVDFRQARSPSVIRRLNGESYARVLADLIPGATFSDVVGDLEMALAEGAPQKAGFRYDLAGDAKGAGEANLSILKIVPIAMVLLILFLLLQFRSFRKVGIAFVALPLSVVGVFPGLWIGGQAFGFMSLLGILALVGIAINNIILLVEAMEHGNSIESAIRERFRAIFLTTSLTILGLLPLALEESTLWPPLAWTMISGLIVGTFGTLVFVPILSHLFLKIPWRVAALSLFLTTLVHVPESYAREYSVAELLERSSVSKSHRAAVADAQAAKDENVGQWREAYMPRLKLEGEYFQRSDEIETATPFGNLKNEDRVRADARAQVSLPVFRPASQLGGRSAARAEEQAEELSSGFRIRLARFKIGKRAIEYLLFRRMEKHALDVKENLSSRLKDVRRLLGKGQASEADELSLTIEIQAQEHQIKLAGIQRRALLAELRELTRLDDLSEISQPPAPQSFKKSGDSNPGDDIRARQKKAEALLATAETFKYTSWPHVDLFARHVVSEGRNVTKDSWQEAGVAFRWELFSSGSASAKRSALRQRAQALAASADQEDLERRHEVDRQGSMIQEKINWLSIVSGLRQKAERNRRIEERRYREGRISLAELLRVDNLALDLSRDADTVALQTLLECLNVHLLTNQKINSVCE